MSVRSLSHFRLSGSETHSMEHFHPTKPQEQVFAWGDQLIPTEEPINSGMHGKSHMDGMPISKAGSMF